MNLTLNTSDTSDYMYNYSPSIEDVFGPKRDNLYVVIPITVIYIIIFISGLVGNISTCIVIARNKSMHTATNFYLFSLAVSDLLLLISGLPPEIYSIWSRYPYIFGQTFCVLRGLFAETSSNASILTITAFTAERYVAICHPFLSHTMSKLSRVVKLILIIWLVAISFAIPQALQFGLGAMDQQWPEEGTMCLLVNPFMKYSFEMSTLLFFVLPMTLITVLYALIGIRLRSSSIIKRDNEKRTNTFSARTQLKLSARHQQGNSTRRVLKMLVAVVVAFFICWAPFHAQRLVAIYVVLNDGDTDHYRKIYEIVTYISGILYFVSTTINPLLYNIMSNKFREAFKETFSKCCGISRGHPQRSYSILSRSAQRAPDSTDSYRDDPSTHTLATMMSKNSADSIIINPSGRRFHKKVSFPDLPNVIGCDRSGIKLVSTSNVEKITPSTILVTVHVANPPPTRFNKFIDICQCTKSNLEPADSLQNVKKSVSADCVLAKHK